MGVNKWLRSLEGVNRVETAGVDDRYSPHRLAAEHTCTWLVMKARWSVVLSVSKADLPAKGCRLGPTQPTATQPVTFCRVSAARLRLDIVYEVKVRF